MSRRLWMLLLAGVSFGADFPKGLPVFYIPNSGQAPSSVRFMAKGSGLTAYFQQHDILLRAERLSVTIHFDGANPGVLLTGETPQEGRTNFLTGKGDRPPTSVPIFGGVRYTGLYRGIDMIYGGNGRRLKSEFVVAPGSDPSWIRMRYSGGGKPVVEEDGSLSVPVNGRRLTEAAPEIYQSRNGLHVPISGNFEVHRDGTVRFVVGPYNTAEPLIIDPLMSYSMLLGGSGFDAATAIAVDSEGSAFIAGYTDSYNLSTNSALQGANSGGNEAFVAKLNPAGTALAYCTYLGGSGDDRAYGIVVDTAGSAYVAGTTGSGNFPTRSPIQSSVQGGRSAFVIKLNAAGNALIFGTYLGGNGSDTAYGIAIDSAGDIYVTGDTTSTNFPAAGFQSTYHGSQDAFIAKIRGDGSRLLFATYLGGAGNDHSSGIAVNSSGSAYITGSTYSADFPVANAFQRNLGGWSDAFIARLSTDGNSLVFSSYLGGSAGVPEVGEGIALDSQGAAYVVGITSSADFPVSHALQPQLLGSIDAFLAKFNSAGALMYCTYLGGSSVDVGNAVAVDSSGSAYVAGYTYSNNFPVTVGIQAISGGDCDAFIAKISPTGDSLLYGSYLGGNGSDTASGVAIDLNGDVYLCGWSFSPNFPVVVPAGS